MTGKPQIGLIDYGVGNFTSVLNALEHLGYRVVPVRTPEDVLAHERLVLPGVGAFAACMRRLQERRLVEPIREVTASGVPFLGICVGMQLLASVGEEFEDYPGLDIIPGRVSRIDSRALRLPHVGWNAVQPKSPSPLFGGLGDSPTFYFVHSYHMVPADPSIVLGDCAYGSPVTAVIAKDNVYGVQFHPEKSQQAGLRLLRNFAESVPVANRSPTAASASL